MAGDLIRTLLADAEQAMTVLDAELIDMTARLREGPDELLLERVRELHDLVLRMKAQSGLLRRSLDRRRIVR